MRHFTSALLLFSLACGRDTLSPAQPAPTTLPGATALSGQLFEVTTGGRIPTAGHLVTAVARSESTRVNYYDTTTQADGRFYFAQLSGATVVLLTDASGAYRQVCGAFAVLHGSTQLDVEITSKANPQPSPTLPPLRVRGQIYEMTDSGRLGVAGAMIGLEHDSPDAPFLTVVADANGRYTACGIPPDRPISFATWHEAYMDTYNWHRFHADTTLDIEIRRR